MIDAPSFLSLFLPLFLKMLPLYGIIILGFISGRYLSVQASSISSVLVYIISPFVIFIGVFKATLTAATFFLPLIMFVVACTMCLLSLFVAKRRWKDATANIFAFSAGTGNTGYFGLPVAIALFGQEIVGPLLCLTLGLILFENTLGFYITSRGNFSSRASIKKVLTLPTLYAFGIAVILSGLSVHPPEWLDPLYKNFLGTYTILGMMLIGIALGVRNSTSLDIPFTAGLFFIRFIAWPAISILIVNIDAATFALFTPETKSLFILLSLVPLAANTVAFATELNAAPEKASTAVLLSTIFALFFIPAMVSILI